MHYRKETTENFFLTYIEKKNQILFHDYMARIVVKLFSLKKISFKIIFCIKRIKITHLFPTEDVKKQEQVFKNLHFSWKSRQRIPCKFLQMIYFKRLILSITKVGW